MTPIKLTQREASVLPFSCGSLRSFLGNITNSQTCKCVRGNTSCTSSGTIHESKEGCQFVHREHPEIDTRQCPE